jgi:cell volume regulation protein A
MDAKTLLGTLAILVSAGLLAGRLARTLRIPDIVLFILAGLLVSPSGLGLVDIPPGSRLPDLLLTLGAACILFDGGAELDLGVLRTVWPTIALLSTVGVAVTAALTGAAVSHFFGIPILPALLVAVVIAPTDPAAIIPILSQTRVRPRLAQTVVAESAFNDAVGATLAMALLAVVTTGRVDLRQGAEVFLVGAAGGIVVGAIAGLLLGLFVSDHAIGFLEEHSPVVAVLIVAAAYAGAEAVRGSGFMAVFVAGIVVGNLGDFRVRVTPRQQRRMRRFLEPLSLLARILIFVTLGARLRLAALVPHLAPGLAVVGVFALLARPAAVLLCALPDRRAGWSRAEVLFICWTRETGVIPAALAGLLMREEIPHKEVLEGVTTLAILATILVQGGTAPALARRLRLTDQPPPPGP